MSILVVSFISIGINGWSESTLMDKRTPIITGDINAPTLDLDDLNVKTQSQVLVSKETKIDSSDTTIINKKNFKLKNKALVKNQK
jgi:hypothetical protein